MATIQYDTKTGKKLTSGQSTIVNGVSVRQGSTYNAPGSSGGGSLGGGSSSVINIDSNPGQSLAPGQAYTYQGQTYTQPGAATPTPTVTPTTNISSANLQVGSSGQSVKDLQTQLGITADGIFGPQTQAAVKAYQTSNGLVSDGIVGINTASKMNGTPTPPSNILPTDTLGNNPKVTIPEPTVTDTTSTLAGLSAANQARLDQQLALQNQSNKNDNSNLKDMFDSIGVQPSEAKAYTDVFGQPISAAEYKSQQNKSNELTAQLDSITKGAQVAMTTLESQAGGKGVTSTFLGRQQQEISRQAIIQGLPISAELNAVNGRLESAKADMTTYFKAISDDNTNAYNYKKDMYTAFYDVATAQDKAKLDLQMKAIDNQYAETVALTKSKQDIATTAVTNGASATTLTAIANATDFNSALTAAGSSLTTSSNEIIDVGGNKMLVDKRTGKIIKSYGGGTGVGLPVIRTVNGKAVDGYTLLTGDDPYFIAQKYSTDMVGLKALNPKITDWLNIQPGVTINVPSKSAGQTQALYTILGSAKFTKEQKADITNAIANGQDPFTVIKNQAKNIMGQTLATDLDKAEIAETQLRSIDSSLKAYYAAGGKTDIFSGNYEKTINKLGSTTDTKLVGLTTEIALAMQAYRLAVTGTAASVQEDARIDNVFPGITSGEILNNARTQATIKSFQTKIDAAYRNTLGSSYDALKSSNIAQVDPLQNVNEYGDAHPEKRQTIIQMQMDGLTIEAINNWVNQFK